MADAQATDGDALLRASASGDVEVVAALLKAKASVDARDPTSGDTPLLMASRHGHKETSMPGRATPDTQAGSP